MTFLHQTIDFPYQSLFTAWQPGRTFDWYLWNGLKPPVSETSHVPTHSDQSFGGFKNDLWTCIMPTSKVVLWMFKRYWGWDTSSCILSILYTLSHLVILFSFKAVIWEWSFILPLFTATCSPTQWQHNSTLTSLVNTSIGVFHDPTFQNLNSTSGNGQEANALHVSG